MFFFQPKNQKKKFFFIKKSKKVFFSQNKIKKVFFFTKKIKKVFFFTKKIKKVFFSQKNLIKKVLFFKIGFFTVKISVSKSKFGVFQSKFSFLMPFFFQNLSF